VLGKPPETVPDDLNAREFFDLGFWYEEKHQLAMARQCYNRVIELEPDSNMARDCKRALNVRIPVNDVSQKSIERVHRGLPNVAFKPKEAMKMAKLAVEESPDYEAAHRLMGACHLQEGQVEKCKDSLATALRINPNHAPSWVLMARAYAIDMDYDSAAKYIRMAREYMPDDDEVINLERGIEHLIALDE
jgi:tetratricopeptide (TPR) repeat protein